MNPVYIRILVRKKIVKFIATIAGIIFTIWLTSLLSPFFESLNSYVIESSRYHFSYLINFFTYEIPVYSIVLFLFVTWILQKIYKKISLSRKVFKITKAEYGSGNIFVDITSNLNQFVIDNKLNIKLTNGIAGGDPTPGTVKVAKVNYEFNNKQRSKKYKEEDIIDLP